MEIRKIIKKPIEEAPQESQPQQEDKNNEQILSKCLSARSKTQGTTKTSSSSSQSSQESQPNTSKSPKNSQTVKGNNEVQPSNEPKQKLTNSSKKQTKNSIKNSSQKEKTSLKEPKTSNTPPTKDIKPQVSVELSEEDLKEQPWAWEDEPEEVEIKGEIITTEQLDPLTKWGIDMMDSRYAQGAILLFSLIFSRLFVLESFSLNPFLKLSMIALFFQAFGQMSFFYECKRQRKKVDRAEWRIFEYLRHKLGDSGEEIFYRGRDSRLNVKGLGNLSILIRANYNLVFAISVVSFQEAGIKPVKVFYDNPRQIIMYRKPRGGKATFYPDIFKRHRETVAHLVEHQPDLMDGKVINMIIFCNPINISIYPDTPIATFGKEQVIFLDDMYLISENRAFRLIAKLKYTEKELLESLA